MLSLLKIKPKNIDIVDNTEVETPMDKLLIKIADISVTYPKQIIAISTILIFLSLLIASQLRFSHKPIVWFDEQHPVRKATNIVDDKLNGSVTLEIIIDTKKENGLYEPSILNAIDSFSKEILKIKSDKYFVGKTLSVVDIIKETNKALNENKKEAYIIPQDKNLIAQELLLFENSGSDDLEDIVDSRFSKVRVTHKVPWKDSIDSLEMMNVMKKSYEEAFPASDVTLTGIIPILMHTFTQSINSSVKSYYIAFSLIALSMIFIMGSVRLGLISMIPNLTPILLGVSLMYIFNFPLDMFTLLIGSIAIGLAVDDTIHFMHNFKRYYFELKDTKRAVEETFYTTGKAMVITSIVLSLGFYAYIFGNMESVQNFGFITGSVIIFALIADLFLAPALMVYLIENGKLKMENKK